MAKIVESLTNKQIEQLHQLYQQEWWSGKRSLTETKLVVYGSSLIIGIVNDDNRLVGFARVLTDYIFKALIFDVIVAKDHRSQGLGDQLISLIRQHEKLQKVKAFELYCLPEMVPFYQSHEFSDDVGEIKLMRLALR